MHLPIDGVGWIGDGAASAASRSTFDRSASLWLPPWIKDNEINKLVLMPHLP